MNKNNDMNIVHFIFAMVTGGLETLLIDILNNQIRNNQYITLLIVNDNNDPNLLDRIDQRINIVYINRPRGSKNPYYIYEINYRLYQLNPDVVHCHDSNATKFIFRMPKVKYLLTEHSIDVKIRKIHFFDKVFVVSESTEKDIIQRYNVYPILVYNGISVKDIKVKNELWDNNFFNIVQIGRLCDKIKQQSFLLKACVLLKKYVSMPVRVDFIGDGESRDYLEGLAKELDIEENVRFLGNRDRSYIYSHLADYQLLVQPSTTESFGLTIAEGLAAGVPVLISNLEGPMEIIREGEFGSSFPVGNMDEFIKKVIQITQNYSFYKNKAMAGRDFVSQKFDIEKTASQYLDEYLK